MTQERFHYVDGKVKFSNHLIQMHEMRNFEVIVIIIHTDNNHTKIKTSEELQITSASTSSDIPDDVINDKYDPPFKLIQDD